MQTNVRVSDEILEHFIGNAAENDGF